MHNALHNVCVLLLYMTIRYTFYGKVTTTTYVAHTPFKNVVYVPLLITHTRKGTIRKTNIVYGKTYLVQFAFPGYVVLCIPGKCYERY